MNLFRNGEFAEFSGKSPTLGTLPTNANLLREIAVAHKKRVSLCFQRELLGVRRQIGREVIFGCNPNCHGGTFSFSLLEHKNFVEELVKLVSFTHTVGAKLENLMNIMITLCGKV